MSSHWPSYPSRWLLHHQPVKYYWFDISYMNILDYISFMWSHRVFSCDIHILRLLLSPLGWICYHKLDDGKFRGNPYLIMKPINPYYMAMFLHFHTFHVTDISGRFPSWGHPPAPNCRSVARGAEVQRVKKRGFTKEMPWKYNWSNG